MLFSLFCLSLSYDFGPNVMHFTDLPPNDGKSYFIMIHGDGCQHCTRLAPTWVKAAEMGAGLTTFGELSCTINETACRSIGIDGIPKVLFFFNGKIYDYPGMQLARLMVNWVSQFTNDTAIIVNKENYDKKITDKAAILFTQKIEHLPKIWAGIQNRLDMKDVQFFASSDEELKEKLGLEKFPAVYSKNGNEFKQYTGKLVIKDVVEYLKKEFKNNKEL